MDSVKIIFINLVEAKKYIEKTKHKQYLCYLFQTKNTKQIFNEINKQSMFRFVPRILQKCWEVVETFIQKTNADEMDKCNGYREEIEILWATSFVVQTSASHQKVYATTLVSSPPASRHSSWQMWSSICKWCNNV